MSVAVTHRLASALISPPAEELRGSHGRRDHKGVAMTGVIEQFGALGVFLLMVPESACSSFGWPLVVVA
jgi:hypothetical protein